LKLEFAMLTPSSLAVTPNVMQVTVAPYDFDNQSRPVEPLLMGSYTGSSIQTFDSHGKPSDSRGDSND
jgi:hypothetical protein